MDQIDMFKNFFHVNADLGVTSVWILSMDQKDPFKNLFHVNSDLGGKICLDPFYESNRSV